MNHHFENANITPGSRGAIVSDINGTLITLKDGTEFCEDLFVCMIGWKNSGYDAFFHSASENDQLIEFRSLQYAKNTAFFERDYYVVTPKSESVGIPSLAAFDDDHSTHKLDVAIRLDPNEPHVRDALKRIADEYRASGFTKILTFNPDDFKAPAAELNAGSPDVTGP